MTGLTNVRSIVKPPESFESEEPIEPLPPLPFNPAISSQPHSLGPADFPISLVDPTQPSAASPFSLSSASSPGLTSSPLLDLFKPPTDSLFSSLTAASAAASSPLFDLSKPPTDSLFSSLTAASAAASSPLLNLSKPPTNSLFSSLTAASAAASSPLLDLFKPPTDSLVSSLTAASTAASGPLLNLLTPSTTSLPSLQFSAFDSTKLGSFSPISQLVQEPLRSLSPLLDSAISHEHWSPTSEASYLTNLTSHLVSDWANTLGAVKTPQLLPLLTDFQHASTDFSSFLQSIRGPSFNPVLLPLPARSFFTSADALMEIEHGPGRDQNLQRDRETTRHQLETYTTGTLDVSLAKVDRRLCKLWHGAIRAITSDNPDKLRHALTSLRELFTQVIHLLAPDDKVMKWTCDPSLYHNSKPTREARLRYICSPATTPALADFIHKDVRSVLALAKVFQEGTHAVELVLSPLQVRLIFIRIESALCALIAQGSADAERTCD
jgi:predicted pPIWI-associating nuclease